MANVLKMSKIEHYGVAKTKELTVKQILSMTCSTCGSAPEEACELQTGALRTEPYRDRKLSAAEDVEATHKKR
jgi:hypothetical protein